MAYRIDDSNGLISPAALDAASYSLDSALESLIASPEASAIFRHATRSDDLPEIEALAVRWRARYTRLIIVGAGGSGLSGQALSMLKTGRQNVENHSLLVFDNLDAELFSTQLNALDLHQCCFLLVSKSGSTRETCAQAELLLEAALRIRGNEVSEQAAIISMQGDNPLRALAKYYRIPAFDHDEALCGRFSLLSNVGLIPAAFMGLDIHALRQGAHAVLNEGFDLPARGAALHAAHSEAKRNIHILMPYSERLYGLALWWRQAFAESLGKRGKGATPVLALGTADQHSQLQLYLDGPDDKFFTFILPQTPKNALGDLQAAQAQATVATLVRHKKPVRVFHVEQVDEQAFGALFMQLTLEIILLAALLKINPFDQPAVEESKRLTQHYLSHPRPHLQHKAAP